LNAQTDLFVRHKPPHKVNTGNQHSYFDKLSQQHQKALPPGDLCEAVKVGIPAVQPEKSIDTELLKAVHDSKLVNIRHLLVFDLLTICCHVSSIAFESFLNHNIH
jgi:hypothetical protein